MEALQNNLTKSLMEDVIIPWCKENGVNPEAIKIEWQPVDAILIKKS